MNRLEFDCPKDWVSDLQPPILVFDLPVKGCDLLLRLVRKPHLAASNFLILLKDTRHPKKLIFGP
jgi:hypothetical protein